MEPMQLIRKLILLLLLFPSLALAQIDIPVQTLGNYFSAGQNLTWGASGTGGFNNNFILPGLGGITTNMCVFVQNNNPSNAHLYNFNAYVTSNPATNAFAGNSKAWTPLQLNSSFLFAGQQDSFASSDPRGPTPFLIVGATGAKIALSFSGSGTHAGTPDTASIWGMYTLGTNCSAYVSSSNTFTYENATMTSGTVVNVFGRASGSLFYGDPSSFSACTFNAAITNNSGTTPTMNIYVQDSDLTTGLVNDRVSFVQATTGTSNQEASLQMTGSSVPIAVANGTLAAGSEVPGKFSDEMVLKFVLTGTNPSYDVIFTGHCN